MLCHQYDKLAYYGDSGGTGAVLDSKLKAEKCDIQELDHVYGSLSKGIAFQKNSELKPMFDYYINKFKQTGQVYPNILVFANKMSKGNSHSFFQIDVLIKKWLPSTRRSSSSCESNKVTAMTASNVMSAFVFLAIGAGGALCILIFEALRSKAIAKEVTIFNRLRAKGGSQKC